MSVLKYICAIGLAAASVTVAAAQGVPPVNLPQLQAPQPYGFAHDVHGVALGMTVAEAQAALAQVCNTDVNSLNPDTSTRSISYRGVGIETQPYPGRIACADGNQTTTYEVDFSSPLMGNRVVAVKFYQYWSDPVSAPSVPATRDALISKYGATISYREHDISSDTVYWIYTPQNQPLSNVTNVNTWAFFNDEASSRNAPLTQNRVVSARLSPVDGNSDLLRKVEVNIIDSTTKVQDMDLTMKYFNSVGEKIFDSKNKAGASF